MMNYFIDRGHIVDRLGFRERDMPMTPAEKLITLNVEYQKQLHAIHQMTLGQWETLSLSLGVAGNNREHAAKKLAIRALGLSVV